MITLDAGDGKLDFGSEIRLFISKILLELLSHLERIERLFPILETTVFKFSLMGQRGKFATVLIQFFNLNYH